MIHENDVKFKISVHKISNFVHESLGEICFLSCYITSHRILSFAFWLTKLEGFPIWPFPERVCRPQLYGIRPSKQMLGLCVPSGYKSRLNPNVL